MAAHAYRSLSPAGRRAAGCALGCATALKGSATHRCAAGQPPASLPLTTQAPWRGLSRLTFSRWAGRPGRWQPRGCPAATLSGWRGVAPTLLPTCGQVSEHWGAQRSAAPPPGLIPLGRDAVPGAEAWTALPHTCGVAPLRHESATRDCAPLACSLVAHIFGSRLSVSRGRATTLAGARWAARAGASRLRMSPYATPRALANTIAATNSGKTDIPRGKLCAPDQTA